jgi:hypothetical protein
MGRSKPSKFDLATLPLILENGFDWVTERRAKVRKYALAGAILLFAIGLAWAIQESPDIGSSLRLGPLLLLLLIGAPVTTLMNSVETYAISRIAGGPMSWRTCVELSIYSSAANMLPIPAGGLARLAGMKAHGVGYVKGSATVLLSFTIWGGLAFAYAAAALLLLGQMRFGLLFALCSLVLLAIAAVGFARFGKWKLVLLIASMRIASFPLEALRYWLAFLGIGAAVSYLQSSILVVASFTASAFVVVPGGIGVTESVIALLATIVGVSAATGFLAGAIGRIVRLIGLSILAGGLFLLHARHRSGDAARSYSGSA